MPMPSRILIVEDETDIAEGLGFNLQRKGYAVELVADGHRALARAEEERWDLILLDVHLPGPDGFEICQELRREGDFTPILMLTARDQPDDVVYGLKSGADDYLVKPFDLAELLARVEGLLRRKAWMAREQPTSTDEGGELAAAPQRVTFGSFWVDFESWEAQTRDGVVELSRKEMEVLRVLTERPNRVVSRRELLERVWELPHHPNPRVVDNVIVALRKAFEENAWRPRHIRSVRGTGYRFVP